MICETQHHKSLLSVYWLLMINLKHWEYNLTLFSLHSTGLNISIGVFHLQKFCSVSSESSDDGGGGRLSHFACVKCVKFGMYFVENNGGFCVLKKNVKSLHENPHRMMWFESIKNNKNIANEFVQRRFLLMLMAERALVYRIKYR